MPRILDNYRDADGLPVTATFAAFMIESGFRTYREAQDSDGYNQWMIARLDEFSPGAVRLNVSLAGLDRTRFLDWLDQRAVDHVARNAVEHA